MKILYFYQYFTTPRGAWSTRVYEFARRWVEAGDSVTVVTSVYDKSDLRAEGLVSRRDVEGIDVRIINVRLSNKHGFAHRIFSFLVYAAIASWYALTVPADVVVASSGPISVAVPGLLARYVRRRPFVFEVRDLWPEGAIQLGVIRNRLIIALARRFERLCYRTADRVVVLSEGMRQWIREAHGRDSLDVVPNAADNELARETGERLDLPPWAIGRRLVLYAGTLGLIDDCGQILEMAAWLRGEGSDVAEVVIIGDGKERPALEERARQLALSRVHFLGQMPKTRVLEWLKLATCALFVCKDVPFLATASPNKLFDAFAAGVPVVQTTQGWIKELLKREECGLTVAANDAEALGRALLRLSGDSDLRARMAENARRVGRELFDRDRLSSKMRDVLAAAAGVG